MSADKVKMLKKTTLSPEIVWIQFPKLLKPSITNFYGPAEPE